MEKGKDHTGVSIVFICHDGAGSVLLSKRGARCRDEQGTWDPGGGGLEFGDTVKETLRKEIFEEYCTTVVAYEFLGYRDVHREHNGHRTHWIALDFLVQVDKASVKNGEPHKLDALGWYTLDTLPNPQHSQFPYFLEKYGSRLAQVLRPA